MYVIDITRSDNYSVENDLMFGKRSSDTKEKIINYIHNYAIANCDGLHLDKDILDEQVNIELFSLRDYLLQENNICIDKDLIIQSIPTTPEKCLIVKCFNNEYDKVPAIYLFHNNQKNRASGLMAYFINDSLITTLNNENKLEEYEKNKKDIFHFKDVSYSYGCQNFNMYNGGLFLEELLNNSVSYNELKEEKKNINF
ncbi:MAG: hypothetical protein E7166_00795 [Firmicutes bacterium]|nr:hypothetical protein [Bacillota bacterium]